MKMDATAAAYGLVQVVFADAAERLATALFLLRQQQDPTVRFERIFRCSFGKILKAFQRELKQFGPKQPEAENLPNPPKAIDADDLQALEGACTELSSLSKWRNQTIHARVRLVDDGLALYDGKTGNRLSITTANCFEIIQRLTKVIVTFEAYLPALFDSLDLTKRISALSEEWESKTDQTNDV